MIHWEEPKDNDNKDDDASWWYRARSTDIEQTSYVLLGILEDYITRGREAYFTLSMSLPIVRWLSKQRNDLGGWSSTQVSILI